MKIDLHTHSVIGSACSHQAIEQIAADARARGLDAVCLTDHDNVRGLEAAQRISAETGFPIFVGMEMGCVDSDILVFGRHYAHDLPRLRYEAIRPAIDLAACALIPVHAYRGGTAWRDAPEIVRSYTADFAALEVFSCNVSDADTERLVELAAEVGLPGVGASDSHAPGTAGLYYTEFEDEIASLDELIAALKSGRFSAVRADRARKAERH